MAQAVHRRQVNHTSAGNLLNLILMMVLVFGGLFYGYRAFTTGELLWWSTTFSEQPRQLAIIDRGERVEIPASDPLFSELTGALNESISRGYSYGGFGISDVTWQRVEANGLLVEADYGRQVKLRGGIQPTDRLLLLVGGKDIWSEQVLFRATGDDWDRIPLRVHTIDPLRDVLQRHGYAE
jgi:hypothetical protein